MVLTDDEIIRLCHQGRQEGFTRLLDAYQPRVYRRAYSYLRDREEALDATQDVFMRVLQAIGHFRQGHPIWPWLRQITTNTCLNRIRAQNARPETLLIDDAWEQVESMHSGADPEQMAMQAWDRLWLAGALDELPPLHRMVVILRHQEDLSYDEIARTMNLPLGTVKTYLFRARQKLRVLLQRESSDTHRVG